jgi:D-alanyl-lipoteichoic acid acyltransferase DltB (MBOAT superfamily)
LLDFFVGQKIQASNEEAFRRRLLMVSVVANLGLLSVFKYTSWLSTGLSGFLAGFGIAFSPVLLALPPAISFYTFQSMSYTIDIYRREFRPYRNVVDYLSFVAFFPHLVAGPIMRARDLLPQLARLRPLPTAETIGAALFMILFGLFQKTALADNCGSIVEFVQRAIGKAGNPLPPGLGLVFVYAFAFQIYCDFAAYSTIARGIARLFGVELIRNFLTPYLSTNPSEFWTRWHISLSTWLRDYLYIPLGGNQRGPLVTLRNLIITMFFGGLWHGAGVLFIAWGLYHGLLLVIYRLLPLDRWLINRFAFVGRVLSMIIFFHLVCVGWIFFRAAPHELSPIWQSIVQAPAVFGQFVGLMKSAFISFLVGGAPLIPAVKDQLQAFAVANWILVVLSWGLFLFAAPMVLADILGYRRGVEFPDLYVRMPLAVKCVAIVALLYGVVFFARRETNEFIYFAF